MIQKKTQIGVAGLIVLPPLPTHSPFTPVLRTEPKLPEADIIIKQNRKKLSANNSAKVLLRYFKTSAASSSTDPVFHFSGVSRRARSRASSRSTAIPASLVQATMLVAEPAISTTTRRHATTIIVRQHGAGDLDNWRIRMSSSSNLVACVVSLLRSTAPSRSMAIAWPHRAMSDAQR